MTKNSSMLQPSDQPKDSFHPAWKATFVGILIFSVYHFIRDLLQLYGLDSAFTDIGHRSHQWCGTYCDEVTIPFDIFGIIIPIVVLKRKKIGVLGWALIVGIPVFIGFSLLP